MDHPEIQMHIRATFYFGMEASCGKKNKFETEEDAWKSLSKQEEWARHPLEAYPCGWCSNSHGSFGWHVGRVMGPEERKVFSDPDKIAALGKEKMEKIEISASDPLFGAYQGIVGLRVHNRKICQGEYCSIHNPSDHHMVTWPLHWRGDRGIMERTCPHGIGHIDPDDSDYRRRRDNDEAFDSGIHGCDGCCFPPASP